MRMRDGLFAFLFTGAAGVCCTPEASAQAQAYWAVDGCYYTPGGAGWTRQACRYSRGGRTYELNLSTGMEYVWIPGSNRWVVNGHAGGAAQPPPPGSSSGPPLGPPPATNPMKPGQQPW